MLTDALGTPYGVRDLFCTAQAGQRSYAVQKSIWLAYFRTIQRGMVAFQD